MSQRADEGLRGHIGDRGEGFGEQGTRLWTYLRRLGDLNRRIRHTTDMPAVLQEVVDLACEVTQARYGALGVFGPDGRVQQFLTHGLSEKQRARIGHLPEGLGLLGYLQELEEPLRLDDLSSHPRSSGFPAHHPPMRSFLGIPIRHGDEPLGNLYLTEKEGGGGFTEDDEVIIVLFVAQAAIAIHNARLHFETRARLRRAEFHGREMELLHSIVRAAISSSELDAVLEQSLVAIRAVTEAELAEVWIRERGSNVLERAACDGETEVFAVTAPLSIGEGLIGIAAQTLEPVFSPDLERDERFSRRSAVDAGFRAFQALPLVFRDETLGVLGVASRDPALLGPELEPLLRRAADELAVVIHSTRLARQLETLAEERGRLLRITTAERARLAVLVETSPVGVLIADADQRVQVVNQEARRLLDIRRRPPADLGWYEEAIQFRRPDGTLVRPDDLPLRRALAAGELTRAAELTLITRGGREIPVLVDAAPISVDGRSSGAIAIFQDISPLVAQREAQTALERYAVRDSIARDLHDDIIQSIYAVGLGLRGARMQDEVTKEQALERATTDLNSVIADLRAYIYQLSRAPEELSAETMLRSRLESLVASPNTMTRWAIEVSLGQEPLPPSMERQLYLVGRELISNVHRHAEASEASLSLRLDDSRVVLEVRDNGIGFDRSSIREGAIGIRSIEQRFADLGGSLLIETERGSGTRVVGELSVRDFAAP